MTQRKHERQREEEQRTQMRRQGTKQKKTREVPRGEAGCGMRWPHGSAVPQRNCTRCSAVRCYEPDCSCCVLCHVLLLRKQEPLLFIPPSHLISAALPLADCFQRGCSSWSLVSDNRGQNQQPSNQQKLRVERANEEPGAGKTKVRIKAHR